MLSTGKEVDIKPPTNDDGDQPKIEILDPTTTKPVKTGKAKRAERLREMGIPARSKSPKDSKSKTVAQSLNSTGLEMFFGCLKTEIEKTTTKAAELSGRELAYEAEELFPMHARIWLYNTRMIVYYNSIIKELESFRTDLNKLEGVDHYRTFEIVAAIEKFSERVENERKSQATILEAYPKLKWVPDPDDPEKKVAYERESKSLDIGALFSALLNSSGKGFKIGKGLNIKISL